MGPAPDIRLATIDDAHGVALVHVRSWQAAYRGPVKLDERQSMTLIEQRRTKKLD